MRTKVIILLLTIGIISCAQHNESFLNDFSNDELILITQCKKLIDITEEHIIKAGVIDSQEVRIGKYPYLRVNRFLSSFRHDLNDQNFAFWLNQLQGLGLNGWKIELKNLPLKDKTELNKLTVSFLPEISTVKVKLISCSEILSRLELKNNDALNKFGLLAVVPSAYNTWQQILGLYPLTALPFRIGIYRWHKETLEVFNRPLESLPVKGELTRYLPGSSVKKLNREEVVKVLQASAENPLHIPMPSANQQQQLFDIFAPVFEMDVVSDSDRVGGPKLGNNGVVSIDTENPVVYKQISHSRVGTKILLQLNYMIWFPSRPKTSSLDLLGGNLDGIIWRVTLSPEGEPLIFDSIHACGCYHFFFPTQYTRTFESNSLFEEPVFTPQGNIVFNYDKRLVIRVEASTHYIQKIYTTSTHNSSVKYYQLENSDDLRSAAMPNGENRSLFNNQGIIEGSERGERFLFWPMGIANPGAMRQWGHHATAFVGRRHFDDARLFEGSFEQIETE